MVPCAKLDKLRKISTIFRIFTQNFLKFLGGKDLTNRALFQLILASRSIFFLLGCPISAPPTIDVSFHQKRIWTCFTKKLFKWPYRFSKKNGQRLFDQHKDAYLAYPNTAKTLSFYNFSPENVEFKNNVSRGFE